MKKNINKTLCAGCERYEDEVDLEPMPCCQAPVCWDYCLYEEPGHCPSCKVVIRVHGGDDVGTLGQLEPFVEVIRVDPNKTLAEIFELLTTGERLAKKGNKERENAVREECADRLRSLADWIEQGGFFPGGTRRLSDEVPEEPGSARDPSRRRSR